MVTRSKLKLALSAEKGVDWRKVKEKRKHRAVLKRKAKRVVDGTGVEEAATEEGNYEEFDENEDGDDDLAVGNGGVTAKLSDVAADEDDVEDDDANQDAVSREIGLSALDDSDSSESEVEMEAKIPRASKSAIRSKDAAAVREPKKTATRAEEESDFEEAGQEEEESEDIPMSDLEDLLDEDMEDLVSHSRLTINNTAALTASLNRIRIPTDSTVPFATHQSITSSAPTADAIPDISDDLQTELAFYAQSLEAAKKGRKLLIKEGVSFSRPNDYFAEMVKDDGHMEKVRAKLVEEATAKKAASEARKLRDLKKFGKQVQVAKLQERQKAKRETLEKIKVLKRKRQESSGDLPATEADLFDVAVDKELKDYSRRKASAGEPGAPSAKRQKKNEKYGFGGRKRYSKSGDAASAGDLSGFSAKRMKGAVKGKPGKTPRLGKSRRKALAAKR